MKPCGGCLLAVPNSEIHRTQKSAGDFGVRRSVHMVKSIEKFSKDQLFQVQKVGAATESALLQYPAQILIGESRAINPNTEVNHATGIVLKIEERYFLATALHVIEGYEKRRKNEPNIIFQVVNMIMDPMEHLVWSSKENDVALVGLKDEFLPLVNRRPFYADDNWPFSLPGGEIFLGIVGFPKELRKEPQPEHVRLFALGSVMRVTSRGVGNVKLTFERERLIAITGQLPHENVKYGGMSGSPAFLMSHDTPKLVGLVTDHSALLDTFIVGLFEDVPNELGKKQH